MSPNYICEICSAPMETTGSSKRKIFLSCLVCDFKKTIMQYGFKERFNSFDQLKETKALIINTNE